MKLLQPIAWKVYNAKRNTITSESLGHWVDPYHQHKTLCGRIIPGRIARTEKKEYWLLSGSEVGECELCTTKAQTLNNNHQQRG